MISTHSEKYSRNKMFRFLYVVFSLLMMWTVNLTIADEQGLGLINSTRAMKDDGHVRSCYKKCQDVNECTCKALESLYKYKEKTNIKCENGFCIYCIKTQDVPNICSVGKIKNNKAVGGTFECCDALLGTSNKNPRQIDCRGYGENYLKPPLKIQVYYCMGPCDQGAYGLHDCYDKDGYIHAKGYSSCQGSKPNTHQTCEKAGTYYSDKHEKRDYYLFRDCGAEDAPCESNNDCCKGDFDCDQNKKCKRICSGPGGACDPFGCCAIPGKKSAVCHDGKCTYK